MTTVGPCEATAAPEVGQDPELWQLPDPPRKPPIPAPSLIPWELRFHETARCTGHCCDGIWIPTYPGELRMKAAGLDGCLGKSDQQLPNMLEYLGRTPEDLRLCRTSGGKYRCKHWDGHDCLNYENRPRMCFDYPEYGKKPTGDGSCTREGCTRRIAWYGEEAMKVLRELPWPMPRRRALTVKPI